MGNFFAELKRRHIYRVGAAYAVVAWVLLQLVNNVAPILELPPWIARAFLLLLVIGFPVALVLAWVLELKARASVEGTAHRTSATRMDFVLAGALAVVIALILYEQLMPSTGARTAQTSAAVQSGGISVAVLPFGNLSGDTGQEFFSDGMTEEITSALAKVPDLQVVARASAFQFKGEKKDMRAVGQVLGARYLIDGSVRKAGNRVRITAQLIRADSGVNVWSDSYDRELTDVFAIQENIAQAIAGALRVPLGLKEGDTLVSYRTSDLDSYQQYLRARALYRAFANEQVVAILEPVVARDPGFAPAWALLSRAYNGIQLNVPGLRTGQLDDQQRRQRQAALDHAEKAAREAIRLDPRHAGGYAALAGILLVRGNNWAANDDLNRQALALDPNDADTLFVYSLILTSRGRLKEALSVTEQLRTLEPFVPIYNLVVALLLEFNGQIEASIPIFEAVPQGGLVGYYRNVLLADAYASSGRYTEGADTLLAMPAQSPVSRKSIEDAARLLRSAPAKVASPEALPALEGELNFVYAYIGAPNRVFEFAERAVEIGAVNTNGLRQLWNPSSAPVRKTERFKTLVRNAGLVDYWRARGWPDLCRPMGADDFVCD